MAYGIFCGLLGRLCGFHKAAILLSIDSIGADILSPCRRVFAGTDILSIQLIGNSLAVFAAGNGLLFCFGKILAGCLLCQCCTDCLHIPGLTQFRKSLHRGFLNGSNVLPYHGLLIVVNHATHLLAGKLLAGFHALVHSLTIAIGRIDFQRLRHKRPGVCTVKLLGLRIFVYSIFNGGGSCTHDGTHGHAANNIPANLDCCIQKCLFDGIIPAKSLFHILSHTAHIVGFLCHDKDISYSIGNGCCTFSDAFCKCLVCQCFEHIGVCTKQILQLVFLKQHLKSTV